MAKKSKKRVNKSTQEPREAEVVETEVRRVEANPASGNPMIKNIIILVLVLIGLYLIFGFISGQDDQEGDDKAAKDESSQVEESEESAKDGDGASDDGDTAPENQSGSTVVNETDAAYDYTVGEGESYTTIARLAIASVDDKLSAAERVAAETKLTTDAGAEWLNAGQDLKLTKETVRAAIDWAKGLSDEQKAAWQSYADLVAW